MTNPWLSGGLARKLLNVAGVLKESWMHETAAAILTGKPLPEAATPEEVTFQQRLAEDIGKVHAAARGVRLPAAS